MTFLQLLFLLQVQLSSITLSKEIMTCSYHQGRLLCYWIANVTINGNKTIDAVLEDLRYMPRNLIVDCGTLSSNLGRAYWQ